MKTAEAFRHVRLVHPGVYEASRIDPEAWAEFENDGLVTPQRYNELWVLASSSCKHIGPLPDGTISGTRAVAALVRDSEWVALGGDYDLLKDLQDGASWPCRLEVVRRLAEATEQELSDLQKDLFGVLEGKACRHGAVADRSGQSGAPRRNDLCPCGSGRKFKRCCRAHTVGGTTAEAAVVSMSHYDDAETSPGEAAEVLHAALPRRSNVSVRDDGLDALKDYVAHTGTTLMKLGTTWQGILLSASVSSWRSHYRKGQLSNTTTALLEALPNWTWDTGDNLDARCLKAVQEPRLAAYLCTTSEMSRWVSMQRQAWAEGTADVVLVALLGQVQGWQWLDSAADARQPATHPAVAAGIECLRFEKWLASNSSQEDLEHQLRCLEERRLGARLQDIADTHGVSRESIRQDLLGLVSKATHPSMFRWSILFWRVWQANYAVVHVEGRLEREDAGAGVSVLRLGSASPAWAYLRGRRPLLLSCLMRALPGTQEAFVPAPGSGRHILDIAELATFLSCLIRSGVLYESQVRALTDQHPCYPAAQALAAARTGCKVVVVPQSTGMSEYIPIAALHLPTRATNVLARLRLVTAADLAQLTSGEILALPNAGVRTLEDIERALATVGLSLRKPSQPACGVELL